MPFSTEQSAKGPRIWLDAPGGNDHLMCPTLRPETFPDGRALLLLSATEAEVQRFVGTCSTYIRDPTGCSRILPLKIKLGASSFKDPVLAGMISSVRPRGALTTLIATDMFNLEPTKLDLHKHGPFLSCGPDYTNPVCHMPLARVSIRLSHGIVERDGTQEMRELDPPTNVMGHLSGTWTLGDSALQAIKTYVQNSPASSIGGQPDLVLRLDSDSNGESKWRVMPKVEGYVPSYGRGLWEGRVTVDDREDETMWNHTSEED